VFATPHHRSLCCTESVHTLPFDFVSICFNNILPSTTWPSECSLSFRRSKPNFLCVFIDSMHVIYPSNLIFLDLINLNAIWRFVQIIERVISLGLDVTKFSQITTLFSMSLTVDVYFHRRYLGTDDYQRFSCNTQYNVKITLFSNITGLSYCVPSFFSSI
jgi:hypothetical protein